MQQCHQLSSLQSAHVPHLSSLPTLGIVKKHNMPEDECHELDKDIATCLAQTKQPVDKNTHFGKYVTKLRSKSITWCFTPSQPVRLPNLGGSRETTGEKSRVPYKISKAFKDFLVRYRMKRDKLSIVKRNAMMRMIVNITDGIRQQNKLD